MIMVCRHFFADHTGIFIFSEFNEDFNKKQYLCNKLPSTFLYANTITCPVAYLGCTRSDARRGGIVQYPDTFRCRRF